MATTLSKLLKKAVSSSVIPLANRRTSPGNYTFTTPLKTSSTTISNSKSAKTYPSRETSIPAHRHFSALAENKSNSDDDTLLGVIQSEIDCYEEKFHEFSEAPREFPFKIEDDVGKRTITLTREYKDEEIKVNVLRPKRASDSLGYDDESSSDDDDEEEEDEDVKEEKSDPHPLYVYLNVTISKKNRLNLEFNVAADADGIRINSSLRVKNPNADNGGYISLSHMHEKLQKAFQTYLEVRGLEPSNTKFLCDYIVQRKHTKHTVWLNNLKNSVTTTNTSRSAANLREKVSPDTLTHHHNSAQAEKRSVSDDNLLSAIESQIVCAEEKLHEFDEALKEFPFKIKDGVWERITLTREYQDEEIEFKVQRPWDFPENSVQHYAYTLFGSVSNQSGINLTFDVTADSKDGIKIKTLDVKNPNEYMHFQRLIDFSDWDANLQKTFYTYLEVRGIEPSITKILHECMDRRNLRICTAWLKNFKNFIAN